ncbi:MAG: DNA polymerase Y family protein [Planctomycetota bacterium]|jgi:DNA polymerase-4
MRQRDIIHVDIDAFLASVEQIRDPSLRGRPVVVGGERGERGLVLSSTYEARRHGVVPGLTLSQAARLLPAAFFLKGDYQEAQRLSGRTWEVCRRYTPLVEVTSLDDCYLDVTGSSRLFGPAVEVAERIRREVAEEVGFGLSLGVGGNRTVARVATVFSKPGGVTEVPRGGEAAFLAPLPVRRLPGVGHRTEKVLHRYNVRRIEELSRVPRWLMEETFGEAIGSMLYDRARGVDEEPVRPGRGPRSVSRETSFDPETADRDVIEGMLFYLLERAAAALRGSGHRAKRVEVKIHYVDGPGDARSLPLPRPTNREREIWGAARSLLLGIFRRRVRLKHLGVALTGLTESRDRQRDLFVEEEHERTVRLHEGIDRIRGRFGFRAITAGRSIGLLDRFPQNEHGFVLKTPSLTR